MHFPQLAWKHLMFVLKKMRLLLDLQLYDGFRARYHGKVAHPFQRPLRQR